MSEEELRQVAWLGDHLLQKPVTGVIVDFHGLGGGIKSSALPIEQHWADAGGLVVFPYYGPWSWMNRSSRGFADRLLSAVYEKFMLGPNIPLIITGSSMGGQGALIYTRHTSHQITACMATFPVCDVEFHFTERSDLPPTMRYAYRDYPGKFEDALIEHSPIRQVQHFPRIPYLIIHGDQDAAVNKQRHSDRLVAEMRRLGHDIEYLEVPGMGHGSLPENVVDQQNRFVQKFLLRRD